MSDSTTHDDGQDLEAIGYSNAELAAPVVPQGRRARRYKLAWVLMAVLLLIGILPLFTLSTRLIDMNKESLKTQQQQNQLQLASSLAHQFETFVEARGREVRIMGELLTEEMAARPTEAFLAHLASRRLLERFIGGDILFAQYTHRNGQALTARREGLEDDDTLALLVTDGFAQLMNVDLSQDVRLGRPFYSLPAVQPAVLLSTALGASGRRVGVLSVLVGFSSVLSSSQNSAYTMFALDAEGRLFTAPGDARLKDGVPYQELEIVREFEATGGTRVMPYTARGAGNEEVNFLGASAGTRHGWGVFVQVEEYQAYNMVQDMKWNTWFHAGVAAVGAMVLGLLFAGWVSRPIKLLADSSLAFAEGDFHARVKVRSGHEVGELAETFNVMAEALEGYISRLKHAAVENTQLFLGSVRALAAAIDAKDAYTRGHSERVRRYAATLARAIGLPPEEVWKVEIGALLHDVGKIGIQDRILNKPGALTPEEYEIMKTHPVRGANIMESIRQLRYVIPAMKHHHERWDGGGYPDGLQGELIPYYARLVTIADCWDAMTTNRPYQKAITLEKGIERLEMLSGRVFDPVAVRVFIEGLRKGLYDDIFNSARQQVQATASHLPSFTGDNAASAAARENLDPDCLAPPDPSPRL